MLILFLVLSPQLVLLVKRRIIFRLLNEVCTQTTFRNKSEKTALVKTILGDPGAVGRVDKMSEVKVYCKIETSPWVLTLTEPVPEAFELPASDWPEKILFWPINEEEQPGDSDVFLHDVVFLIDRQSCVARSTGKVSRGKFQN